MAGGLGQTISVTATQNSDSLLKTAYVSGDNKNIFSVDTLYSGLQSGVNFNAVVSGLKSLYIASTVGNQRVKFYGLSGSVTFDLPDANMPAVWWSGNPMASTNPLANCSGNVTGLSIQQLSGFASGVLAVHAIHDSTP